MKKMTSASSTAKDYFAKHPDWNKKYQELIQKAYQDEDVQHFLKTDGKDLTKEQVMNSYSKIYEYVQEKKAFLNHDFETNGQGLKPILILNHGYIDVSYEKTNEQKELEKQREISHYVQTMNIAKSVREASVSSIVSTPERKELLEEMTKFVTSYGADKTKFQQGLYIYGEFGRGKSYILGAIANNLAQKGITSLLVHLPSLIEELKATFDDDNNHTLNESLEKLKKVDVLMIDDIGAENLSAWSRDSILGVVLEYRMQEEKVTFFSSNFDFATLEKHLAMTKSGEEPLKAKRLMERVKFLSKEILLDGIDYRNGGK